MTNELDESIFDDVQAPDDFPSSGLYINGKRIPCTIQEISRIKGGYTRYLLLIESFQFINGKRRRIKELVNIVSKEGR